LTTRTNRSAWAFSFGRFSVASGNSDIDGQETGVCLHGRAYGCYGNSGYWCRRRGAELRSPGWSVPLERRALACREFDPPLHPARSAAARLRRTLDCPFSFGRRSERDVVAFPAYRSKHFKRGTMSFPVGDSLSGGVGPENKFS
jgi:hypothetical protein